MASSSLIQLCVLLTLINSSIGSRIPRKLELWVADTDLLTYHDGEVLKGSIPITIIWYGMFTPSQKSIISDFLLSLTPTPQETLNPSVSQWWSTLDQLYLSKVGDTNQQTQVLPFNQVSDEACSLGKSLGMSQISQLVSTSGPPKNGITLVLTADDVAVEGFCQSHCGSHGSDQSTGTPFIWVGNSETQCPGQCAWPFHQTMYGPQTPPLVSPNGDIGIDGMVMTIASMIAGTVTNPFGEGYYQGVKEAPLEACSACPGVYGPGAFPGYAGQLQTDPMTGASYNANGGNGRKYLLPALFDPMTSTCSTLV